MSTSQTTESPIPTPQVHLPIKNPKSKIENPLPLFPRHRFTLLVGDTSTGKSLLATHIAARIALRSPLPPHPYTPNPYIEDPNPNLQTPAIPLEQLPGTTIFCSREDDDDTLDNRFLVAAHGTPIDPGLLLTRRHTSLVPPRPDRDATTRYSPLLQELHDLTEHQHLKIGLLVLDPIADFLGRVDASHNPALIREALCPLLDFTRRHGITVVGTAHRPKSARLANDLYHFAHSHAYVDLARSVLLLARDPESPNRRLLIPLKNSFASADHAYAFTLHPRHIPQSNLPFPYIAFEPDPLPHHPLLPPHTAPEPPAESELAQALDFLRITLAHGPRPSAQLQSESRSLGITPRTLSRAKQRLRVHSFRTPERWFTTLPEAADPEYQI